MLDGKRGVLAAACVVLLCLAGAGVWAIGARSSRPLPAFVAPPVGALLPVPPAEENGWLLIRDSGIADFGTAPSTDDEWPRDDADAMARVLLAWAPPTDGEAVVRRAFTMPRFAPDCPLDMRVECPALGILQAHRLAVALALRDVVGETDAPIELSAVLALSRDALARPRSLLTAAIGAIFVDETLERIADLATLLESGRWTMSRERLAQLAAALDALDSSEISIERGMIIEWMEMDQVLADTFPTSADGEVPWVRRSLGDQYAALVARARDPRLPPPSPVEVSRFQRWMDPGGTVIVEATIPAIEGQIDRSVERRRAIETSLADVRPRVRALLARAGE